MGCNSESASHYAGCACSEERWRDQVARLTRERDEARERAASLSRELLDAMQARDRLAERAVTMQLMLDAIEGWATDQPGEMPTAVADGWSTALSAAVARIAAAESERDAWTETARTHAKNEDYYRGLIDAALKNDPTAYVADDGSISEDVLRAKLPELYRAVSSERDSLRARLAEMEGAMRADDNRLRDAAIRVWGEHVRGCDTPDAMADLIEYLRDRLSEETDPNAPQRAAWWNHVDFLEAVRVLRLAEQPGTEFVTLKAEHAKALMRGLTNPIVMLDINDRLLFLINDWWEGRQRTGMPLTFVDQRLYNAVHGVVR